MALIFPSLSAAPILRLEEAIHTLEPYCAGFHLDIMDFHFVPNITWGPDFVNAIRKVSEKPLWVHLMVEDPESLLSKIHLHPNDLISVHYEHLSNRKIKRIIEGWSAKGMRVGIALKPKTAVEVIKHFDYIIDHVLLMSVEPGFSGQLLLPDTYERLQTLYDLREEYDLDFGIGLDGGLTKENVPILLVEGADFFAMGSGIFNTSDPIKTLQQLKRL